MPDAFLRIVPSDADRNDVRLYDPTIPDSSNVSASIATSAESSSDATLVERYSLAIASADEQSSAASGAERSGLAVATAAEQSSAVTGVERIDVTVATANEVYADAIAIEREADTIATSAESYSDAALSVTPPLGESVSLVIASSTEASSDATGAVSEFQAVGVSGGGGQFVDPWTWTYQFTVKAASAVEVSSSAIMSMRPRIGMHVASSVTVGSGARLRERIPSRIATDSIARGSDSAFSTREGDDEELTILYAAYDVMEYVDADMELV
jgi:hypothetical protein